MSEPKAENIVIEVNAKDNEEQREKDIESCANFVTDNDELCDNVEELTKEEAEKIDKMLNKTEEDDESNDDVVSDLAGEAKDLLGKFKSYISGSKLDDKCAEASKRTGVKKDIIKNAFIKNALSTVADALNLTISIAGDIITGGVKFIENIILNVVNFASGTLHKLITAVTLNCGTVEY